MTAFDTFFDDNPKLMYGGQYSMPLMELQRMCDEFSEKHGVKRFHIRLSSYETALMTRLLIVQSVNIDGNMHRYVRGVQAVPPPWTRAKRRLAARALCVYWFGLTSHLYAEGGAGRARDCAMFEDECAGIIEPPLARAVTR